MIRKPNNEKRTTPHQFMMEMRHFQFNEAPFGLFDIIAGQELVQEEVNFFHEVLDGPSAPTYAPHGVQPHQAVLHGQQRLGPVQTPGRDITLNLNNNKKNTSQKKKHHKKNTSQKKKHITLNLNKKKTSLNLMVEKI